MKFAAKLIIWVLVAFLCIGILIAGFGARLFASGPWWPSSWREEWASGDKAEVPDSTHTSAQAQVGSITLDITWANLDIYATEEANIRCEISNAREDEFTVQDSGSAFRVQQHERGWRRWFFGWGREEANVAVYVPKSFTGTLQIDSASGRIVFYDDISVGELSVEALSGRTEARGELQARRLYIDSASGRIGLQSVVSENARIHSLSGRVEIERMSAQKFDVQCASGSVQLKDITGGGKVECTSGSLDLRFAEVTGDVELEVISGSVDIELPADSDIRTRISTTSGRTTNDFSGYNGQYNFTVEGVSGRIDIRAK